MKKLITLVCMQAILQEIATAKLEPSRSTTNPTTTTQESTPIRPKAVEEIGARVDDFLTRMSGFGYSGNVLLAVNGTVVLEKGFGLANRERGVPYAPHTIFDIGSMAKTFTAAAVLKLELADRLSVQDPIERFLPNVPKDKRTVTVHQLLTHTSGITADFPFTDPSTQYEDVDRDEAIRRILAAPLDYPPGGGQQYSNGGYILLAAVVERAGGRPFRDYMRETIFAPAGLKNTGFWGDETLDRSHVALGYNEYGETQHDPMTRSKTSWQDLGGGQMLSTLGDLARWRDELANGRFLPAGAVARMWTPGTKALSPRDGDYGYGWFIGRTDRGTTVIQHGGDYLGTGAEFQDYREDKVLMITSTNVRHDLYPTRNRTDRVIPKIIFGGEHPEPPAWIKDDSPLRAAVGNYLLATGGTLSIHERGGAFFIGASGQDAADLLLPAPESVHRRRGELSGLAQRAFEGLRIGDTKDFMIAAGGADANPEFASSVQKELADFGMGALREVQVLGTFPTGYPRGNPPDYETTLLKLGFERGESLYAIRWANGAIGMTEVPRFSLAADTPIQPDANRGLVAWNIVFSVRTAITPRSEGGRVTSLTVHAQGGDVEALVTGRDKTHKSRTTP